MTTQWNISIYNVHVCIYIQTHLYRIHSLSGQVTNRPHGRDCEGCELIIGQVNYFLLPTKCHFLNARRHQLSSRRSTSSSQPLVSNANLQSRSIRTQLDDPAPSLCCIHIEHVFSAVCRAVCKSTQMQTKMAHTGAAITPIL